jgi:hypothetical protein
MRENSQFGLNVFLLSETPRRICQRFSTGPGPQGLGRITILSLPIGYLVDMT